MDTEKKYINDYRFEEYAAEEFTTVGIDTRESELIARPKISYYRDAWRRFKANRAALVAAIILVILIFFCIFGPAISGYAFEAVDKTAKNQAPSSAHWFGTDKLGRDLFARTWIGGRVSMIIGLAGAAISTIFGCIYGGISAYFGGKVDAVMMRIVEVLYSVPYLIIVILMSVVVGNSNIWTLLTAMTITSWCGVARLVRGQMLQLSASEFVMAARGLGVSPFKIIRRHLIPNTLNVIIVDVSFAIPSFIFSEAFLSYLGLGIQPPNTSWGALAYSAQAQFFFYPYQLFFPSLMIALTMLSFTLMGDGLRDALDPKLRK